MSYGNGTPSTHEPPIDWKKPILKQRRYYALDPRYNKPLLSKVPLTYRPGFHKTYEFKLNDMIPTDPDLIMFHLRSVDVDFCMSREVVKFNMTRDMEPFELSKGYAYHWNQYLESKKSGELCKYAVASFLGVESNKTLYWDNTGIYPMAKLEDYWGAEL